MTLPRGDGIRIGADVTFTGLVDAWPYGIIEPGETWHIYQINKDDSVDILPNKKTDWPLYEGNPIRCHGRPFIVRLLPPDFAAALSAEQSDAGRN